MSNIIEDWGLFSGPRPKPTIARRLVDGVCGMILFVPMCAAIGISWLADKAGIK